MEKDPEFLASGRCKHFLECGGLCSPEHPQHGQWSVPVELPERLGMEFEERAGHTCPAGGLDATERRLFALFGDWSFYGRSGLPLPGSVADQPVLVTEALAVLLDEQSAIVEAKREHRARTEALKRG